MTNTVIIKTTNKSINIRVEGMGPTSKNTILNEYCLNYYLNGTVVRDTFITYIEVRSFNLTEFTRF
jgi:hypothetical protein